MNRCEDYPCCGHGPESTGGDGGGCPDEEGRFNCVLCGHKMSRGVTSAICRKCKKPRSRMYSEDQLDMADRMGC